MRTIQWIPLAALALAACVGDGSGPKAGRGRIALGVSSQQPAAGAGAASVLLAGDSTVLAANPDTVIVRSVDLVLRRIKLEPVEVPACESDNVEEQDGENHDIADENDAISDEDSEGCEEIKAGPVLVSLPLGTTAIDALVDVSAPAGQYDKLQFKIHAPKLPRDSAFLRVNPSFDGVSIRVSGTFSHAGTRTTFTYESALEVEQEVRLEPPITVGAGAVASLTLRFDLSGWFAGPGGAGLVDPGSANAGGVNAALVGNNIRRSIHAFEDEDEDGHDDHDVDDDSDGGHGGDSRGGD
jgi:hypothetical protein